MCSILRSEIKKGLMPRYLLFIIYLKDGSVPAQYCVSSFAFQGFLSPGVIIWCQLCKRFTIHSFYVLLPLTLFSQIQLFIYHILGSLQISFRTWSSHVHPSTDRRSSMSHHHHRPQLPVYLIANTHVHCLSDVIPPAFSTEWQLCLKPLCVTERRWFQNLILIRVLFVILLISVEYGRTDLQIFNFFPQVPSRNAVVCSLVVYQGLYVFLCFVALSLLLRFWG